MIAKITKSISIFYQGLKAVKDNQILRDFWSARPHLVTRPVNTVTKSILQLGL